MGSMSESRSPPKALFSNTVQDYLGRRLKTASAGLVGSAAGVRSRAC
jgi:hypothetical protein